MIMVSSIDIVTEVLLLIHIVTDIPYPTPADRKDLENLVKSNWDTYVQAPVAHTTNTVTDTYEQTKNWIFDSYAILRDDSQTMKAELIME